MFLCRVHLPPPDHLHTEKRCVPYHRDKSYENYNLLVHNIKYNDIQARTFSRVLVMPRVPMMTTLSFKGTQHTPEDNGTNLGGVVVRTAGEQVAAGVPLDGVDFIRMS